MLFLLSKFVAFLVKPITWVLVSLGIALFKPKKRGLFLKIGFGLLILFSNPALFNIISKAYEPERIPLSQVQGQYDTIILLGGFSELTQEDGFAYATAYEGNRLTAAMELYKAGKADKILISGGASSILGKRKKEALVVRDFLLRQGIDSSHIIVEMESKNTYENAVFTKNILDKMQSRSRSILVTSSFHMPRALGLYQKQGMNVLPFPSGTLSAPLDDPRNTIVPSAKVLWLWSVLIKEWVGTLTYKIAGKI